MPYHPDNRPRPQPRPRSRRTVGGLAAVLAASGLLLAACGDSDSNEQSEQVPTQTSAAPVTTMDDTATTMDDSSDMAGSGEMMGASGPACGAVPTDGEGSFAGMADDPAATAASNNPVLSTLVSAVSQAGLVDTLNGEGPFTIFAPTNDAFAAIPADQLDAVLADTELLTNVLTYHVIAGDMLGSDDLVAAGSAQTVNGGELTFGEEAGTLTINGSTSSVCMNVPTANATVHIIDQVLIPS
jgi:transforming growth factor-beta-induced protein